MITLRTKLVPIALLTALIGGSIGMLIMYKASSPIQAAQTKTVTFEASATPSPKRVYYCEGITKKGERCKRRVKKQGDYCWQHKPKS